MRAGVLPAVLFLVLGCAPPKALNPAFEPMGGEVLWEHGLGRCVQVQEGVTLRAAFLEAIPDALLFEVALENRSEESLLVSPERLTCEQVLPPDLHNGTLPVPAVDPETQLDRLRREAALIEHHRRQEQRVNTTLALVGLATAVVDTADRVVAKAPTRRHDSSLTEAGLSLAASAGVSEAGSSAQAAERLTGNDAARRQWEQACLRRTTLLPGERYRGQVVFHLQAHRAIAVNLKVPVGRRVFTVPFRVRR